MKNNMQLKLILNTTAFLLISVLTHGQSLQVKVHGDEEIVRAEGEALTQFPSAFAVDAVNDKGDNVKKIFVAWAKHKDKGSAVPNADHTISTDSGVNYGPVSSSPNVAFRNAIKKRDGTILIISFKGDDIPAPTNVFTFDYLTSDDNGKTWSLHEDGKIDFGSHKIRGMRFHRGVIEDSDGALYALCYGHFEGDKFSRTWIVKSIDGGTNWTYLNSTGKKEMPLSEATIVQCVDGSWLVVMRNNGHKPLRYTRSRDKGLTWTPLALLPGFPVGSTKGDDLNESVDPHLLLMPNGVLVLSYGRPNLHLAFSASGNGDDWSNITTTMIEHPLRKTSAYSAILPVASDKLLQIHDTGANWTYGRKKPEGAVYSVVQKFVDVKRDISNKIDLKTKFRNGEISVETDLNFSRSASPETRIAGAFDGSTAYWSGAFKEKDKGIFTLTLDKPYVLSNIGLCLQTGFEQSAKIRYSADGKKWKKLPASYRDKTHYAIDYTKLKSPVSAKYIEIAVKNSGEFISLNELELYGVPSNKSL